MRKHKFMDKLRHARTMCRLRAEFTETAALYNIDLGEDVLALLDKFSAE